MKILVSAIISVLAAQSAFAERRENKPFTTVNGRTSTAAPAAPQVIYVAAPGGGASSNTGPAEAPNPGGVATAGRTFYGGGRASGRTGRSMRGNQGMSTQRVDTRNANRTGAVGVGAKSVAADPKTTPAPAPTQTEEAPPNFSKPGALIRDTGQQPLYEKTVIRTHTVDAGEIVLNERKAFDVGKAPSVQQGPKDTPPPPNPGTFTRTYTGNGAAANGPTGGTGGSGNNSGGHDNNGNGNNDKDHPGDDDDGHGGTKDKTFADPTGFYSAF